MAGKEFNIMFRKILITMLSLLMLLSFNAGSITVNAAEFTDLNQEMIETDENALLFMTREELSAQTRSLIWTGSVLNSYNGVNYGPSGKETYYNLNMNLVVSNMQNMGFNMEYWVRDDGVKMFGNYIICAANLNVHPRGSLVESSLGTCIVCDTGTFAHSNAEQLDIAVTW